MATSFSLKDFARRMNVVADKVGDNAEVVVRRAALVADQVVVTATPVDTGRARANWLVSIGSPAFSGGSAEPSSPTGAAQEAIDEGKQVIAQWRVGSGPIFISNNVPYIVQLDEGSSAQAPNGMTAQAVLAAESVIAKARLLKDV